MKKIVMIGHEPLTKRTKSIFYIEDFIQAGVELNIGIFLSTYFLVCG